MKKRPRAARNRKAPKHTALPITEQQIEQVDDFMWRLGAALSPYQLIEGILKEFIEVAHLNIELLVQGKIPFRFPRKEYENAPLEHLITMFARHCDNDDLIKRLRSALTDRNYVAHNAIAHFMTHRKKAKVAKNILAELEKIHDEGNALVEQVRKEYSNLKARNPLA
jgi:hypothetical protein